MAVKKSFKCIHIFIVDKQGRTRIFELQAHKRLMVMKCSVKDFYEQTFILI